MARSICSRCGNTRFEVVEAEPAGSQFKLMFVQCSSCGAVVGAVDFWNIGEALNRLAKALGVNLDRA